MRQRMQRSGASFNEAIRPLILIAAPLAEKASVRQQASGTDASLVRKVVSLLPSQKKRGVDPSPVAGTPRLKRCG